MAQEARGNLARWPSQNFGYRAAEVAQLTGMLDEVISELRVAAGQIELRREPRGHDRSLVGGAPAGA